MTLNISTTTQLFEKYQLPVCRQWCEDSCWYLGVARRSAIVENHPKQVLPIMDASDNRTISITLNISTTTQIFEKPTTDCRQWSEVSSWYLGLARRSAIVENHTKQAIPKCMGILAEFKRIVVIITYFNENTTI